MSKRAVRAPPAIGTLISLQEPAGGTEPKAKRRRRQGQPQPGSDEAYDASAPEDPAQAAGGAGRWWFVREARCTWCAPGCRASALGRTVHEPKRTMRVEGARASLRPHTTIQWVLGSVFWVLRRKGKVTALRAGTFSFGGTCEAGLQLVGRKSDTNKLTAA